jgi:hypothetical protein
MILALASVLNVFGIYASLGESICFALGTILFVRGQIKQEAGSSLERTAQARYSGAR